MAVAPSTNYPGKVFFYTADPVALIDAGFNALYVKKRRNRFSEWTTAAPSLRESTLRLMDGQYNYHYLDAEAGVDYEYRAVLANVQEDGTVAASPTPVEQPIQRAIDNSYEAIMSLQEFKELYLWGQDPAFIADNGATQPDYTFVHSIRYGMAKVERKLNLKLLPTAIVETHDLERPQRYGRGEYLMLALDQHPILSIESLTLNLPGAEPYEYPSTWLKLDKETGLLYIVPDGSSASSRAPGIAREFTPEAFEVNYTVGFDPANFPVDLKEVVGKEGAFGPLNVGGDLVGGAGLAGTSLSMDGLSQSITTTNSSTNAGFGARLIQYEKELKETYKTLLPFYKRIRFTVA